MHMERKRGTIAHMPAEYDPSSIESKWQKKWEEAKVFEVDLKKAKDPYYYVVMFPYPSGANLHVGHWYQYGPTDSFARFKKMQGKDVFFPMGYDAFGLPAENYAIKKGVHPSQSIKENVETMEKQFKRMGSMYSSDKAANTSTPQYYRWTQWLFLKMFENDLAYRKDGNVNFCPSCQTVLANEQVWDGKCERCESEVTQKPLTQWYWKITNYSDQLLEGLNKIDWPEKTKMMQRNWIRKKEGIDISYDIEGIKCGVIGWDNGLKPNGNNHVNPALKRGVNAEPSSGLQPEKRTVHITIEPKNREALFIKEQVASSMIKMIGVVAKRHDIILHEACAMSDHVHLLISFQKGRHLEKEIMRKLKGGSAHDFNKQYNRQGPVWAKGSHFEEVENIEQFESVIKYIQQNPKGSNVQEHGRILSKLPITITTFTTRPDTNFGATFIVLAPEHPFAQMVSKDNKEVDDYIEKSSNKTELERQEEGRKKTGVFTGFYAINQLTEKKMPIWISDFVLGGFGTGAVVGVPGHDKRDFEFAQEYDLEVIRVVVASDGDTSEIISIDQVQEAEGTMINSDFIDGMDIHEATKEIMDHMEKNGWGKRVTTYRLRDWLVSRQRYWGALIPIVYDPDGKAHPVPEKHLPWMLPTDVEFKPKGKSPLADSKELQKRVEKIFGKGWTPEVDTMDTFVCSSFYQFRFLAQGDQKNFIPKDIEKKWMPVDMYIGGVEHACMHLIYARFVTMVLKDLGYVSVSEPFQKLIHQGLITKEGAKMSKSKGNVVSPDDFVEKYGSDVFRMYLMFMGPYREGGDWNDTGIKGISRFAQKAYKIIIQNKKCDQDKVLTAGLHAAIKKVTEDTERLHFNTAISALMEFLNICEKHGGIDEESAKTFSKLLAPLAPHLAEELWEKLGGSGFVIEQQWPTFDSALIKTDTITIAVQVNGKVRGDFSAPAEISDKDAIAQAKELPNVAKFIEGDVKKEIYVKGKLVSLVI